VTGIGKSPRRFYQDGLNRETIMRKTTLLLLAACAMAVPLAACGNDGPPPASNGTFDPSVCPPAMPDWKCEQIGKPRPTPSE
jgi:predicted small lipoprotein YifL